MEIVAIIVLATAMSSTTALGHASMPQHRFERIDKALRFKRAKGRQVMPMKVFKRRAIAVRPVRLDDLLAGPENREMAELSGVMLGSRSHFLGLVLANDDYYGPYYFSGLDRTTPAWHLEWPRRSRELIQHGYYGWIPLSHARLLELAGEHVLVLCGSVDYLGIGRVWFSFFRLGDGAPSHIGDVIVANWTPETRHKPTWDRWSFSVEPAGPDRALVRCRSEVDYAARGDVATGRDGRVLVHYDEVHTLTLDSLELSEQAFVADPITVADAERYLKHAFRRYYSECTGEDSTISCRRDRARRYKLAFDGLRHRRPDFAPAHYNLACMAAIRDDFESAAAHLRRAFELDPGYRAKARRDRDLRRLRELPEYRQFFETSAETGGRD